MIYYKRRIYGRTKTVIKVSWRKDFRMGYNKENIPVVHKNNEYFSDKEKEILNLRR